MDYIIVMAVFHCIDDGVDDLGDLLFGQLLAVVSHGGDPALQTSASHQFEHHIEVFLIFEYFNQFDHVRMIDSVEHLDLVQDGEDVLVFELVPNNRPRTFA